MFTAISNIWTMALLTRALPEPAGRTPVEGDLPLWAVLLCTAVAAAGLYTFGMSLNDVMDARRDRTFAPDRPIPAGLISMAAAVGLAVGALLLAIAASVPLGPASTLMCVLCATMILFYDTLGKHFAGVGILTLGLVRTLNMLIACPAPGYDWPIWLTMTHVIALSAICHRMEGKRPQIEAWGGWTITAGWVFLSVAMMRWMGHHHTMSVPDHPWLAIGPALAVLLFVILGVAIVKRAPTARAAGGKLMKYGLLWLIVYDTAWLLSAELWRQAALVGSLLPLAMLSMSMMRYLKAAATPKPQFLRE